MKLSRYFSVFITFVLVTSLTVIVPLSANSQANNSCPQSGIVCLDNQELFTIRANSGSYTPEQRAEIITKNIQYIANNYSIPIDSIKVEEGYGTNNIIVEEIILVTVTDADGRAVRLNRKSLADIWLKNIKISIGKHRKDLRIPSIQDNISIFWNIYIEPYYFIFILIFIFIIVIGLFYACSTFYYFYYFQYKENCLFINKYIKYIKNRWRKCQQEEWANHIYQSVLQIGKLTSFINKAIIFLFGKLGFQLIFLFSIGAIIFTLIRIIYYTNFYVNDELEELRKHVATLLNIIGLLLLLGVLFILINWLSSSRGGTVVLPFDDTTASTSEAPNNNSKKTSNQGKAIADSLVAELHRISYIHNKMYQNIKAGEENIELQRLGKFNFPPLTSPQENIESHLTEVATFEVGKTSFSIGSVILTLKHLWPFGGVNRVISGSLQKYDSTTRLVVRLEDHNKVKAWEVTWENQYKEPMTEKIRDLAYKVAMDLAPDITAQTWDGFKFFTEATSSYYQYLQTGGKKHLDTAKEHCNKAYQAERKNEKLDDLFYKIGIAYFEKAYFDKELYKDAKTAFDSSLEINPKSEYSHTGLGNVYSAQDKFAEAIKEYKLAKRVNKDFPYADNGLGNVYYQLGEFEKAHEKYKDACDTNDQFWHSHFWQPYYNQGFIYLYIHEHYLTDYKDYVEAKVQLEKAVNVNKYSKYPQELYPVRSALALAYLFQALVTIERFHYSKLKEELFLLEPELELLKNKSIPKLEIIKVQEKINYCKTKLKYIRQICGSQIYQLDLDKDELNSICLEENIRKSLEKAGTEIDKAADIALDKKAYIYWNMGLIKLAQIKLSTRFNLKEDDVYDDWKKAAKIADNTPNEKLNSAIYKYALSAIEENKASIFDILRCINDAQYDDKKGCLYVILKDLRIISRCYEGKNQHIEKLIKTIEKKIKNNKTQ